MELKFKNGKFKILVIADAQDTDTPQPETRDIIRNSIERSKPDLVVFLGDNIAGEFKGETPKRTKEAIAVLLRFVNEEKIPFALVFGNHDHEGLQNKQKYSEKDAKEFIMNEFCSYENCLASAGEPQSGCGTFNLLVKDSKGEKNILNLWMMDSNTYDENGGYGYIQPDQTEWYIRKSNELKAENGGVPMPSLLFQHIPVPEVYRLTKEYPFYVLGAVKGSTALYQKFYKGRKLISGKFREAPCCADIAHNQFETWKKQGDIMCAFFGHDHTNDFLGTVDGIGLCAVPAAGYYSYGWYHGTRTITLFENDLENFETEVYTSKELLEYKVRPRFRARHGYLEYKTKVFNNFNSQI